MIKFGKVIDLNTGIGIPNASIEITDQSGTYLGAGASADVNGNFAVDSLQIKKGSYMRVSSVGYAANSYPYDQYTALEIFSLKRLTEALPEYVVTAKRISDQQQKMLVIGGLGLLALLLLTKKKLI